MSAYQAIRDSLKGVADDKVRELLFETQAELFLVKLRGREPERVVGLTKIIMAVKDELTARGVSLAVEVAHAAA